MNKNNHVYNEEQKLLQEETQKLLKRMQSETNFDNMRKQQIELLDKMFTKEEQKEIMSEVFENRQAEKDAEEIILAMEKVKEEVYNNIKKLTEKEVFLNDNFIQELSKEITKSLGNVPIKITVKTLDENKNVLESKTIDTTSDIKRTIKLIKSFQDLEESLWYERVPNKGTPDIVTPHCSSEILVPLLKELKQLPDNDSVVENNKIFKKVARYIIDGKLNCFIYFNETEEMYNWYLDTFFPNQFDHLFAKKIKNLTEKKLSDTTDEVAYRIAVKQLLTLTQDWLINNQFKKNKESALAFFKTDLGLAVVASTVLTFAASRFPEKHLERLSRELRVSTLALAGNETVQMLQDFFKKHETILTIESTIPPLEQKQETAVALPTTMLVTNTNNASLS